MSFLWVFYSLAAVLVIGLPCGLLQLAWGGLAGRLRHAAPTNVLGARGRSQGRVRCFDQTAVTRARSHTSASKLPTRVARGLSGVVCVCQ